MAAVSNCSPLRYFIAIGRAELLPAVLGNITIPDAVFRELTHASAPESVRLWMEHLPDWLTTRSVPVDPQSVSLAPTLDATLDAGESEAIQLALASGPDFILIDERRGRREATLRAFGKAAQIGIS